MEEQLAPPENAYSIDPLLVEDLDRDGRLEIILAGKNLVYRNRDGKGYRAELLCAFPPHLISTALLADVDGDGFTDFLGMRHEGLVLLTGAAGALPSMKSSRTTLTARSIRRACTSV